MEPMNMRRSRWQPSAAWQKAQRSYYYITDTSSTVKPDKDTWTKYEGPVSVLFDNEKGGSKYLWAATITDDGETWLKTSKIQFVYSKKPVKMQL